MAGLSVYYAYRTFQRNRESQVPMLVPTITDVGDPQILHFEIENIGNGLAKNIRAEIKPTGKRIPFESDLLPRKFSDSVHRFDNCTTIAFSDGNNPLFNDGELFITYEDVWGKKYWMKATFKPDVTQSRRDLGHIDKQFSGIFYGPLA